MRRKSTVNEKEYAHGAGSAEQSPENAGESLAEETSVNRDADVITAVADDSEQLPNPPVEPQISAESPQSVSTAGETQGTVTTSLDFLDAGDEDNHYGARDKYTKQLPEGVTSGMLYKDVLHIAWPSMLELFLAQLASMADLMMVGNLGAWAISAVGLCTQPRMLASTMFMAMNVGATALVAQHRGAGRKDAANEVMHQALIISVTLSVIASVMGFIFARPLIILMGAPDAATLAGGVDYLKVQMLGLITMAIGSAITAVLRGVGNSRTAMVYNLVGNLVNVVFNYLLIEGKMGFPRLEVLGASIATVIGQTVSMVLAIAYIMGKNRYLTLDPKKFVLRIPIIKEIAEIGVPAMLEQFVMRAGMIIYTNTVASLGTVPFATHNICMNIQALTFMNGQALSVSATTLVGQSLGKRRPDMAQAYASRTRKVGMAVAIILGGAFLLFAPNIVALYSDEAEVIVLGATILMFVAFIQPFQASQFILAGALRGAGDTRVVAAISFVTVLFVRPGLALFTIKVLGWGLEGAWIALAVDQLLRSLLVMIRFNSGKWKNLILQTSGG